MRLSRYDNNQTISVTALLVITVVTFAVMLIPVYTNSGNSLWVKISATLFPLAGAVAVAAFANSLSIIKKNLMLPAFFVIVSMGATGYDSGCWKGYACAAIILFSWYMTTTLQKEERCAWRVFNIMAAMAAGSLISGTVVAFIPFIFIGLALYDRISIINISASILGAGFVYAVIYALAYLTSDVAIVSDYIGTLYRPISILTLSIYEIIFCSAIGVYIIIAHIAFIARFTSNSILFRHTMLFNYIILFVAITLMILFNENALYEPTICLLTGVTLPFYVEFSKSKAETVLFYTFYFILLFSFAVKNFIP